MFVGLTGGMGCGKTTVLECFSKLDWKTLDADLICRGIYEDAKNGVANILRDRWGSGILQSDGAINRKKIADIVFSSENERLWLNSVMHPKVLGFVEKEINSGQNEFVFFDIPLLFEARWENKFDATVAVWCDRETQISRLLKRGWDLCEIRRRLDSQTPAEEKLGKADFGLINSGSYSNIFQQCELLSRQLKEFLWKKKM